MKRNFLTILFIPYSLYLHLFQKFKKSSMKKTTLALMGIFLLVQTGAFALKPSATYSILPDKYGMKYKEESVQTKDGAMLNTWFFENPKKTTNTVVISGSGDGNMADNLELINQFLSMGWNVMSYDYRGYGKSSKFDIDANMFIYPHFITDLNAVLDFLRKSRAITKFDLYGTGIGAGLSIGVGESRNETRKVIADGPWISLEGMRAIYKAKERRAVDMPLGFDKNIEPQYALEKHRSTLKILIIVSANDPLIGPAEIKPLKGAESYIIKTGTTNLENFNNDRNGYFEKIRKFMTA